MDKNISLSDDISSSSYQVIQEMTSAQSRMHSLLDNLDKISKVTNNITSNTLILTMLYIRIKGIIYLLIMMIEIAFIHHHNYY